MAAKRKHLFLAPPTTGTARQTMAARRRRPRNPPIVLRTGRERPGRRPREGASPQPGLWCVPLGECGQFAPSPGPRCVDLGGLPRSTRQSASDWVSFPMAERQRCVQLGEKPQNSHEVPPNRHTLARNQCQIRVHRRHFPQ